MIGPLVKKNSLWSYHFLFTGRISWFKQMSLAHQHNLCCFWARNHHTRASQYVCLEYISVPVINNDETSNKTDDALHNLTQLINLELPIISIDIPLLSNGEKEIGILSVKLKSLSNIRPAHGTRGETFVVGVTPLEKEK